MLLSGCETSSLKSLSRSPEQLIASARQFLADNDLSYAKSQVKRVLEIDPENKDAQALMAEIIDHEIAEQKETEINKLPEEYTEEEKKNEIKTWVERAEAFLNVKLYDEAILAAEKIFSLDPQNIQASTMIDEIKQKAIEDGKSESLIVKKMYESEVEIRVNTYEQQAEKWLSEDRLGAARLAIEKILLLDPANVQANQWYQRIQARQKH